MAVRINTPVPVETTVEVTLTLDQARKVSALLGKTYSEDADLYSLYCEFSGVGILGYQDYRVKGMKGEPVPVLVLQKVKK